MTPTCRACHAPIPTAHVSLALQAARCPACRVLQDLGAAEPPPSAPPIVLVPDGWTSDVGPRSLRVEFGWWHKGLIGLAIFAAIWNTLLLGMGLAASEGLRHPLRLLAGLAVPHVWIGLGIAYYVVASAVNRTTVTVGDGSVSVQHGPLWWFGKGDVRLTSVVQLFVVEATRRKGSSTYELCALDASGARTRVVGGLSELFQARYLEFAVESALGIEPRAVAGEVVR